MNTRQTIIATVTVRSLADAVSKVVAQMDSLPENDPDARDALNSGVGYLLEFANKYPKNDVTKPVTVQVMPIQGSERD